MCFAVSASMAQTHTSSDAAMTPADNSKVNSAEVNSTVKQTTADGRKNSSSDVALTQQICKSVMPDKHLSMSAHNATIVAVHGAVTLNGVVRGDHEKHVIEIKAQAIAGNNNVTNGPTIAPNT